MENSDVLELAAAPHPDPRVCRAGFDLTHPYVEQCWGAVIGPSGLAIMRRLPVLWTEREPARIGADELAHSLGLGGGTPRQPPPAHPRADGSACGFRERVTGIEPAFSAWEADRGVAAISGDLKKSCSTAMPTVLCRPQLTTTCHC